VEGKWEEKPAKPTAPGRKGGKEKPVCVKSFKRTSPHYIPGLYGDVSDLNMGAAAECKIAKERSPHAGWWISKRI